MANRDKRVQVPVSESQRQKWTKYADEQDGISSVADLVRKSVEQEIAEEEMTMQELKMEITEELIENREVLFDIESILDELQYELPDSNELEATLEDLLMRKQWEETDE